MRKIRWKGRFSAGDDAADRRNRAFIDCINRLIGAAGEREHCREMEELIDELGSEADRILSERPADRDLKREFGHRLLASLPLSPFGGNACRQCGLCDIVQSQVAEHLKAPASCLFEQSGR